MKKIGVIGLLVGCLAFVSYVYLNKTNDSIEEDVYLKCVVFKDDDNDLIPVSINFHSEVEMEEEILNRIDLMKSDELERYGLYSVLNTDFEVLSMNIDEGILTLNMNDHYQTDNDMDFIEALTFVLTDYDDINQVQLQVNGKDLKTLPNSQIPLNTLTHTLGLNNFQETSSLLHETIPVMAYNEKIVQQYSYYIPTTLRLNEKDSLDEQVRVLLSHVQSSLLVEDASLENGLLTVELGSNILLDNETIDQTLQDLILLSLSTIPDVEDIDLKIHQQSIDTKETSQIQYNYIKI